MDAEEHGAQALGAPCLSAFCLVSYFREFRFCDFIKQFSKAP